MKKGWSPTCKSHSWRRNLCLTFLTLGFLSLSTVWAAEGTGFSGNLSPEGGGTQAPSEAVQTYSYYRLLLQNTGNLDQEFSYALAGEANWQTFTSPAQLSWPLYPQANALKLETDNIATSGGNDLYNLQADRAYLHWASGPLEMTAGLFKPNWGSSYFYRPTDYFFPLSPLQWDRDEPLASEGADATC